MKRREFIVSSVAGSVGATLSGGPVVASASGGTVQPQSSTTRKILIAGGFGAGSARDSTKLRFRLLVFETEDLPIWSNVHLNALAIFESEFRLIHGRPTRLRLFVESNRLQSPLS